VDDPPARWVMAKHERAAGDPLGIAQFKSGYNGAWCHHLDPQVLWPELHEGWTARRRCPDRREFLLKSRLDGSATIVAFRSCRTREKDAGVVGEGGSKRIPFQALESAQESVQRQDHGRRITGRAWRATPGRCASACTHAESPRPTMLRTPSERRFMNPRQHGITGVRLTNRASAAGDKPCGSEFYSPLIATGA
jgi:hypothetical protein